VGVWAPPTPPHIPILLSQLILFLVASKYLRVKWSD
jgi:hypothetical protein